MKRLLLPLLAALALPIGVSAETVWLVLSQSNTTIGVAFEKIEMESMDQCLEQGEIFRTTRQSHKDKSTQGIRFKEMLGFICLKGK